MKKSSISKIWPIVKNNKTLRTLSLLNIIFILFTVIFLFIGFSYGQKIKANQTEIQRNEALLLNLQKLALNANEGVVDINLFQNKSFAGYEEVVPFIALLENIFVDVDPKAEVAVKSREDQIFLDHFADYKVNLKINQKKEEFFEALKQLHNSRFIIKITNFIMHYKPVSAEGDEENEFTEAELIIRLYLK